MRDPADGLMVVGVHAQLPLGDDAREQRVGLHLDRVRGPLLREVLEVPDHLLRRLGREVLEERPARGDVQELLAAADSEDRHVLLERALREVELGLVADRIDLLEQPVGLFAVVHRVDVHAARKQQPVERPEVVLEQRRGPARAGS